MCKPTGSRARPTAAKVERGNLYAEVTARIIAELEAGRLPWVQPWGTAGLGPCLPHNAATVRPYSGINILLLWGAAQERGFAAQGWLTFKQALAAGGSVRRGEQGTTVFYADTFVPRARSETDQSALRGSGDPARRAAETGEDAKAVPFLKCFTVFNVAQCDGLPEGFGAGAEPLPECAQVPLAEEVIAAAGVPFRIGGAEAYYAPGPDIVVVPPQRAFHAPINFYRTALHELTHATGHAKRLGRNLLNPFGSKDYAREELVAELGSAFLCAALGIEPTVRHADYIGSWLEVLREDLLDDPAVRGTGGPKGRAIFRAASLASKAADWLLTHHREAQEAQAQAAVALPQAERIAAEPPKVPAMRSIVGMESFGGISGPVCPHPNSSVGACDK